MTPHTTAEAPRRALPTLADIERRRAELLGHLPHQPAPYQPEEEEPTPAFDQPYPASPTPPPQRDSAWPRLTAKALHGIAGSVVRTISPHTEADPAAILLQFLAAFGNLVGPAPHCMVESTRHGLNLFVVLVGESSKARKGTSWRQICRLFSEVDDLWGSSRVTTARVSSSGLIHALRDEQPPTDRRLLLLSEEFASVLHVLGREKSHLSPLLRCAWDSGHLRTLDRHQPMQATGTHISLVGHITRHELVQHLHQADARNGFVNRCLWTCVRRSQCLPEGSSPRPDELSAIARELRRTVDWVSTTENKPFCRDQAARDLWIGGYETLSDARPGLYGAATSRAEAQVLRLSAIYAALDCSPVIELVHLQAALAVWDYCSASAALIFHASTGDAVFDRIRRALDETPEGLTRKEIRALFHGHVSSERIDMALDQLTAQGLATNQTTSGRGRPATRWSGMEDPEPAEETN
jgi:hypothetical protein